MSRAYGCWSGLSASQKQKCFDPRSTPRKGYLQLQSSGKAWRVSGDLALEWNALIEELKTRTDNDDFRRSLSLGKQSLPAVNFALYLVARKPDVAKLKPTIVAECRDIDVAKRAYKALLQMQEYTLAPLLGSYELDYAQSTIKLRADSDARLVRAKKNLCGAQILILNIQADGITDPKSCMTATVGGVICVSGKNYAMTAAHAFFRDSPGTESDTSTNTTSSAGRSRGPSNAGSVDSALSRAGIALVQSKVFAEKRDSIWIDGDGLLSLDEEPMIHLLINSSESNVLVNKDEDWALVPINNPSYEIANRLPTIAGRNREITAISEIIPAATVNIISGVSEPARAMMSSAASLLLLPGSKKSTIVWCALGGSAAGDCGSWLVTPDGHAVAMIVAGSEDGEIFCLPLASVLQSIQQSLGLPARPSLPAPESIKPEQRVRPKVENLSASAEDEQITTTTLMSDTMPVSVPENSDRPADAKKSKRLDQKTKKHTKKSKDDGLIDLDALLGLSPDQANKHKYPSGDHLLDDPFGVSTGDTFTNRPSIKSQDIHPGSDPSILEAEYAEYSSSASNDWRDRNPRGRRRNDGGSLHAEGPSRGPPPPSSAVPPRQSRVVSVHVPKPSQPVRFATDSRYPDYNEYDMRRRSIQARRRSRSRSRVRLSTITSERDETTSSRPVHHERLIPAYLDDPLAPTKKKGIDDAIVKHDPWNPTTTQPSRSNIRGAPPEPTHIYVADPNSRNVNAKNNNSSNRYSRRYDDHSSDSRSSSEESYYNDYRGRRYDDRRNSRRHSRRDRSAEEFERKELRLAQKELRLYHAEEEQERRNTASTALYPYSNHPYPVQHYPQYPTPYAYPPRPQIANYAEQYPGQVDLDGILNQNNQAVHGRTRVSHRDIHPTVLDALGIQWWHDIYDSYYIHIPGSLPEHTMKGLRIRTQRYYQDRERAALLKTFEQDKLNQARSGQNPTEKSQDNTAKTKDQPETSRNSVQSKEKHYKDTTAFDKDEDERFEKFVSRVLRGHVSNQVRDSILTLHRVKEAGIKRHINQQSRAPTGQTQEDNGVPHEQDRSSSVDSQGAGRINPDLTNQYWSRREAPGAQNNSRPHKRYTVNAPLPKDIRGDLEGSPTLSSVYSELSYPRPRRHQTYESPPYGSPSRSVPPAHPHHHEPPTTHRYSYEPRVSRRYTDRPDPGDTAQPSRPLHPSADPYEEANARYRDEYGKREPSPGHRDSGFTHRPRPTPYSRPNSVYVQDPIAPLQPQLSNPQRPARLQTYSQVPPPPRPPPPGVPVPYNPYAPSPYAPSPYAPSPYPPVMSNAAVLYNPPPPLPPPQGRWPSTYYR